MNINTFKKLCLKSNTKKADEIHYKIRRNITEESDELRITFRKSNTKCKRKTRNINI